ncbi:hypothetical protein XENOCAPTIV_008343 [Xenoophorus captivus]|uniref:Uncharacterized protein n=1 Tax=Xenoophorus captivus TaxID=1517983 RepID=A0ABV0Q8T2_9TELE
MARGENASIVVVGFLLLAMDRWRENPRIIADHKEGKTSTVTSHLHGAAAHTHAVKYITKPDRKFTPEIQSKDSAKTPKKKRKPSADVGERLPGGLSGSVYKPGRTAASRCLFGQKHARTGGPTRTNKLEEVKVNGVNSAPPAAPSSIQTHQLHTTSPTKPQSPVALIIHTS